MRLSTSLRIDPKEVSQPQRSRYLQMVRLSSFSTFLLYPAEQLVWLIYVKPFNISTHRLRYSMSNHKVRTIRDFTLPRSQREFTTSLISVCWPSAHWDATNPDEQSRRTRADSNSDSRHSLPSKSHLSVYRVSHEILEADELSVAFWEKTTTKQSVKHENRHFFCTVYKILPPLLYPHFFWRALGDIRVEGILLPVYGFLQCISLIR